jgi:hypothetical protein
MCCAWRSILPAVVSNIFTMSINLKEQLYAALFSLIRYVIDWLFLLFFTRRVYF